MLLMITTVKYAVFLVSGAVSKYQQKDKQANKSDVVLTVGLRKSSYLEKSLRK